MSSLNGRPANKSGKAVFVQRGGKGKLGTQSPPTTNQAGFSPSVSPVPQSSGPTTASVPVKETVINETDLKHMHDRMLFLLSNMIGMTVEITVKNGSKYEGLFHTAFTEGELGIVLRLAKAISGKDKKDNSPLISQMIVLAKDCMAINVIGVDFVPAERTGPERGEREGFKTDTDISRSGDIKQRDLKKWAPDGHLSYGGIEDDLGDTNHNSSTSWDQFAANERLFGVRTDFDEEIYTTKLDRTGADYKAREQQAIQIAQEIQQSVSNNVHMREERGLAVDDSGLDEEDLYGAVVRDPLPASNKYMPPAMRRQQELNQQRRPSTPVQTLARPAPTPTPAPAPVPASVSAQTTPAQHSSSTLPTKPLSTTTPQSLQSLKSIPSDQPAASAASATASTPKPAEATSISRSNSVKNSSSPINLRDLRTHNPVSTLLNAATIQGSKNQQIPEHAVDSKQIEENLAKFAMTVSTFATNDKVLVSQRKTELMQQRKAGLAAELKQFGKELTKKLNTPVPEDVKEIFGKKNEVAADKAKEAAKAGKAVDKEKTLSDVKEAKPEFAKSATTTTTTATTTSMSSTSSITPAISATPATTDKPAVTKPTTGSSFKFNIKASEFKPNVNAAPFTPSFGGSDKKSTTLTSTAADKNVFFGKVIKKGPLPLQSSMVGPFKKGQATPNPASTTPTWPYGQRAFRHQFQVTNRYDDDMMYSQSMTGHNGNGAGGYYSMGPYSYGPSGQFGVPPPMTMGGPNHMVPFLGGGGPVPFSQPPPGMPHTAAGPGYPQMAPTTAPHYAPQGFPPGRSGMLPPSGAPVMMRYPPPEMMATMGPNGMMMHQRPMGMDPQMMHYAAVGREAGLNEDAAPEAGAGN
ncbi:hypothetical protein BGZ96_001188 [Linnemannia gamsii]|uniref:LsmAD domain-containing protein n=1 Tax=Linnemannia gamsii TaxID=64522 RepID=A0ABQ7JMN6_9FUNG|nr:hypothetical protein BGZ96_001188 [Linnemannia gamsii]